MISAVDFRVLLPITAIVSVGLLEKELLEKILKYNSRDWIEDFITALILGTISLILPMLAIGLLAHRYSNSTIMPRFVYFYAGIAMLFVVYKAYKIFKKKLPEYVLDKKISIKRSLETILIIIIILMFGFYLVQVFVYPLRGWDFLHFYLPNAFRIYTTGELANINELNFLPQFKPPLNVLLYAFGFYITQSEQINLIPILFFLGTVLLTYKIALQAKLSKKIALMSVIIFLATPLTYFLIYEYQYYQEVYIMFFTTAAFYYLKTLTPKATSFTLKNIYYALIIVASLTGCILSKISGYVLIFVVLMVLPSDRIMKVIKTVVLVFFAFHLVYKSSFDIYIGTGIVIALLVIYISFSFQKQASYSFSLKRWLYLILVYMLPLAVGIFWIKHILSMAGVKPYLEHLYIDVTDKKVNLHWLGIAVPAAETYLENAHTATFITSSFSILIAVMFTSTWVIFKIIGFVKGAKEHIDLLLWILVFYVIWLSFFASGSIRYLTPILPPLSILTALGFETSVEFFNKRDHKERDGFFSFLLLTLSAYAFLYPALPIEVVKEDFHLRWYYAHTHIFSLIGQILIFNILIFALIWKEKQLNLNFEMLRKKRINFQKFIAFFLIFLLTFVPGGAQIILLSYLGFNIREFQTQYCWFTRKNYQDLINAINALGYPDDNVLLTINTAGIEYYTSQPTIDLFMLSFVKTSDLVSTSFPISVENVTKLLDFFNKNKVTIFVTLNKTNPWYPAFMSEMYWRYPFLRLLFNSLVFQYHFSNEEFFLFTLKEPKLPFVGPINVELIGTEKKASLLSYDPADITIESNAQLRLNLDLTAVNTIAKINVSVISTFYDASRGSTNKTVQEFTQLEKAVNEKFTELSILDIPRSDIAIYNITVSLTYLDTTGHQVSSEFTFLPINGGSVNITYGGGKWLYCGETGFYIN